MSMAVWIGAAGLAMSAVGSYQQSRAAKRQAEYQQQVAYNNSVIAQQNAADARDRGEAEREEHRDRIAQTKGAVTAKQAALGFLVDDEGSTNVDLLADVAEAGELDILKMRDNADREERRALIQGENYVAQAGLYGLQASAQNPGAAAAGTLISGASSVYNAGKGVHWAKG